MNVEAKTKFFLKLDTELSLGIQCAAAELSQKNPEAFVVVVQTNSLARLLVSLAYLAELLASLPTKHFLLPACPTGNC